MQKKELNNKNFRKICVWKCIYFKRSTQTQKDKKYFLLFYCLLYRQNFIVYVYQIQIMHSFLDRHIAYSFCQVIMNNGAIKMDVKCLWGRK